MNKDQFDSEIRRISIDLWNLCKQYNDEFDFVSLSVSDNLLEELYIWVHAWNSLDETKTTCVDRAQFVSQEDGYVQVLR